MEVVVFAIVPSRKHKSNRMSWIVLVSESPLEHLCPSRSQQCSILVCLATKTQGNILALENEETAHEIRIGLFGKIAERDHFS